MFLLEHFEEQSEVVLEQLDLHAVIEAFNRQEEFLLVALFHEAAMAANVNNRRILIDDLVDGVVAHGALSNTELLVRHVQVGQQHIELSVQIKRERILKRLVAFFRHAHQRVSV